MLSLLYCYKMWVCLKEDFQDLQFSFLDLVIEFMNIIIIVIVMFYQKEKNIIVLRPNNKKITIRREKKT